MLDTHSMHTLVEKPTSHSSLVGGSSAARFIHCPGSKALQARAPARPVGEAAHRGSALHHVMHYLLTDPAAPLEPVETRVIMEGAGANGEDVTVDVTRELIDTKIKPALDWFNQVPPADQFWSEIPVSYSAPLDGAYGVADVLFVSAFSGRAGIIDWKFGDGVNVVAKDNVQLKFYLAAAVLDTDWFQQRMLEADITTFDAYIVQPNMEEFVRHATVTIDELVEFRAELVAAKQRHDAGDTTLNTGDWCQFCAARTTCPAWRNRAQDALASLKTSASSSLSVAKQIDEAAQTLSTQALREAYLEAVELSKWADAVKRHVKARFDAGMTVDGLKKVRSARLRHWTDPAAVERWLRRRGLHVADYRTESVLKSVAKIEKLVDIPLKEEHVYYQEVHTVVEEADPRPDVDPSAALAVIARAPPPGGED